MDIPSLAEPLQAVPEGAEGPGLVSLQTSGTQPPGIVVFRHEGRLKRLEEAVRTSASLLQEQCDGDWRRWYPVLITLTYAAGVPWAPCHVSQYLDAAREWLRRRGVPFRYVWVSEVQEKRKRAGSEDHCLHYHVMVWLPVGVRLPKPDKSGQWPHGASQIVKARSAVGYLCKYASKGSEPGDIPKGVRLSGSGGLTVVNRMVRTWRMAPAWVRSCFEVEDMVQRFPTGGWFSRLTGVWEPSRYVLAERAKDWSWVSFRPAEVGNA